MVAVPSMLHMAASISFDYLAEAAAQNVKSFEDYQE
jgi:hypothetical protein